MSYIFAFTSRNGAMRFCDEIIYNGGNARLVNTPQIAGSGCGLSVKCDDYDFCSGILNRGYYTELRAVFEFDGADYKALYKQ